MRTRVASGCSLLVPAGLADAWFLENGWSRHELVELEMSSTSSGCIGFTAEGCRSLISRLEGDRSQLDASNEEQLSARSLAAIKLPIGPVAYQTGSLLV
jgi:hypothetical protein